MIELLKATEAEFKRQADEVASCVADIERAVVDVVKAYGIDFREGFILNPPADPAAVWRVSLEVVTLERDGAGEFRLMLTTDPPLLRVLAGLDERVAGRPDGVKRQHSTRRHLASAPLVSRRLFLARAPVFLDAYAEHVKAIRAGTPLALKSGREALEWFKTSAGLSAAFDSNKEDA
jgi:hypothetical protein